MLTLVLSAIFIATIHGYQRLKSVDRTFADRLIKSMILCVLATALAMFSDTMTTETMASKSLQAGARMAAVGIAMAAVSRALLVILQFANHRRESGSYEITSSSNDNSEDDLLPCRG
ncbi:hypothetical protein EZV61_10780 [Corallincola luteus]|uniref:Uncharacterized protein n=1 Tax=Corallincola luteus TaxID=1775177 RepID=A0ABY2AMA4_9GAMM|nr:hypothetical protein [Corallincola luteus]TCI03350.1 hypothetical protein EZV61_10780 [Corallincola luteus]